jgi:Ca2+-binding RTX toxin-like protein
MLRNSRQGRPRFNKRLVGGITLVAASVVASMGLGSSVVAQTPPQTIEIWVDPGSYTWDLNISYQSEYVTSCPGSIQHWSDSSLVGGKVQSGSEPFLWCSFTLIQDPDFVFPSFQYLVVSGSVSSADGFSSQSVAPCSFSFPYSGPDFACSTLDSSDDSDGRQMRYTIRLAGELESAPQRTTVEANLGSALDVDDVQCDNVPPTNGGTIIGTDGPDVLCGGPGDDTIIAKDGDDIVYGKGGDDDISAGKGDDVAFGGKGDDKVDCGSGDDFCGGGPGNDQVTGGKGYDVTNGATGEDTTDEGPGHGIGISGD